MLPGRAWTTAPCRVLNSQVCPKVARHVSLEVLDQLRPLGTWLQLRPLGTWGDRHSNSWKLFIGHIGGVRCTRCLGLTRWSAWLFHHQSRSAAFRQVGKLLLASRLQRSAAFLILAIWQGLGRSSRRQCEKFKSQLLASFVNMFALD